MGLTAVHATSQTQVKLNDILFKGEILSLNEGDATERVAIGFGEGASDLKVQMRGYQMTTQGLRQLGSGTGESNSGTSPGAELGVVGAVATGNPAGLIISTGKKIYDESTGSSTIQGRVQQIVEEAVKHIKPKFQHQGWVN